MKTVDRAGTRGVLQVATHARVDESVEIDTSGPVTIGPWAAIADDVLILTHEHTDPGHPVDDAVRIGALWIEAHAFIGARAIILPSCNHIGLGATIGAGSVVTCDVPAGEVWAGNPARKIR